MGKTKVSKVKVACTKAPSWKCPHEDCQHVKPHLRNEVCDTGECCRYENGRLVSKRAVQCVEVVKSKSNPKYK